MFVYLQYGHKSKISPLEPPWHVPITLPVCKSRPDPGVV